MGTSAAKETVQTGSEIAQPTPKERRRTKRFLCEGTGEVIILGGALRFPGQVRDLSTTGCCLATESIFTLERGTQVEVVMVVDKVHFRVSGGVRSKTKSRGIGFEFMNVSERCVQHIRELIAELEAKAGPDGDAG